MKIKKIVIALLVIVALVATLNGRVYAANYSFSANLVPSVESNQRVPLGGTFKLVLKISKINVGEGLSGLTTVLKYNEDVLELVDNKVVGLNDWTPTYNKDNGKLALDCAETVKQDTEIAEMTFKVKENTSAKIATVELSNIEGGNSSAELDSPVKASAVRTMIQIGTATTDDPSPSTSTSTEPSTQPSQSTKPSASSIPGTTDEQKTQTPSPSAPTTRSEEDIPKSGSEDYIIPLIIAIAALGLVSFVNYKKID